MEIATLVFSSLLILVVSDVLAVKKPPKTPEQELGEAVAKYVSHAMKQENEKKEE